MKHRILQLFGLTSLLIVFIGTGVGGVLLPYLAPPTAYAAGAEYALDFADNPQTKSELKAAFRDSGGDIGDGTFNVLNQTKLLTKGGFLGTATLSLDKNKTTENNLPIYKIDYYCVPQTKDNYKFSLNPPNGDKPYVRYTMGVSLLDNRDWGGIADDRDYKTYVGVLGNTNVGTVHFPAIVDPDKGGYPAKSFDLPGEGGDNDIRQQIEFNKNKPHYYGQEKGTEHYSFDNPKGGGNASLPDRQHIGDVFDKCMPSPDKQVANRAINLSEASAATKDEWAKALAEPGANGGGNAGGADGNDGDASKLGCNTGLSLNPVSIIAGNANPLNWLFCGLVKGLVGLVDALDNIINSQLSVGTSGNSDQPNQIFSDDNGKCANKGACDQYYAAWKSFRNIALGLMVLAGLLVLISQALGMEILDAYTIRKILPRLLLAAVGITLSWELMQFFVTLTNDLGFGLRRLIYAPFSGLDSSVNFNLPSLTALTILGGVGYFLGGFFSLVTLAGTAALALFIAFLVLVLRQVAIIMLIILAPIGIVAYILPNTQRYYKLWWESFSKALLMFPLITVFIAVGKVFSAVAISQSNTALSQSVGFVAYFAPYFMIPLTFRFAGGALSSIGGFVNDRGRGGFKLLSNARSNKMRERVNKARTGGIYRPEFGSFNYKLRPGGKQRSGSIGRALNKFGDTTLDLDEWAAMKAGERGPLRPLLGRQSDIMKRQIAEQKQEHSMKAAQRLDLDYRTGWGVAGLHDHYLDEFDSSTDEGKQGRAALKGQLDQAFGIQDANGNYTGSWRALEGREDAHKLSSILSQHGGGQTALKAAAELGAKADSMGDLRNSDDTRRADLETVGLVAAAKSGRLENPEIVATRERLIASGGDSGGFAGTRMGLLQELSTPKRVEQARGHGIGYERTKDGELRAFDVYRDPFSSEAQTSFMRISAQELAGGKSDTITSLEGTMKNAASEYEMEMGSGGSVQYKLKDGKRVLKTDPIARARAKQAKERIRYIASYAAGDTDVGRKVQDVASFLEMGDLSFGGRMQQNEGRKEEPKEEEPN